MKALKKISLLFVLFFIYAYIVAISNIPSKINIFQGDEIKFSTLWGISIEASTTPKNETFEKIGTEKLSVNLFDKIKLKSIEVNVMEEVEVIPVGEVVGIKLYTTGVLVVGTSVIETEDEKKVKPYENTDIKEGDNIIAINDNIINNTEQLIDIINQSNGNKIKITYINNEEQKECEMTPVKDKENNYKIGLWVRDSAAGVGTVTFYDSSSQKFAALGHAITDIDTGDIINTASGEIDNVNIVSIIKGEKEEPGKLRGTINQTSIIGKIYKNTPYGIYGVINDTEKISIDNSKKVKVATRNEIKLGPAKVLCGIDGEVKEYDIEISKIYLNNNYDNKSMIIKVTDEKLLSKSGGIIQGMSGSPIIQDNKFIGAVTHVFIRDPQIGYAVFADIMINEINN